MQNMKRTLVALALSAVAVSAFAAKDGYTTDGRGPVVRNNYGECWRTSSWSKDKAIEECDAALMPKKAVAAPAPEAPKVVEAPKPPMPAPVAPAPVVKKMETLTLNAAALFEFDKAVLKEEGKQALEAVAGVLLERKFDTEKTKINVVGFTDRLGKAAHNDKLSTERAAAAREALVAKGLPAAMVASEGKGANDPVTKPEDCKKVMKNRKKLIECYAPDRRVEVQIFATVEK